MSANRRRKLLARNFHSLDAFMKAMRSKDAAEELDSIEGIGDVMAKAITDFFAEEHTIEALDRLMEQIEVDRCCSAHIGITCGRENRGFHGVSGENDAQ